MLVFYRQDHLCYLQILHLWICPLAKTHLQLSNQYLWLLCIHSQTWGRAAENLRCPKVTFPAQVKQGNTLPSRFSSRILSKHHFPRILCVIFFALLCCWLVVSLFKTAAKCSAEVMSTVLSTRKLECALMEVIHIGDAFHSGMGWL